MSASDAITSSAVDAVLESARLAGFSHVDAGMAERLAAGGAAAVQAVRAAAATVAEAGPFAGEPAGYLASLESLTPETERPTMSPVGEQQARGAASGAARGTARVATAAAVPAESWLPPVQPWHLGLCELASRLANRQLRSVEVVRAMLARAEHAAGRTNCFLGIETDAALSAAELADVLLDAAWRQGREPAAPLLGVPLAHKDMFARRGLATSCGSRAAERRVAVRSATVMQRLEIAGAVTLGTLNMAEFALGPTGHNAAFGDCRNAWDPDYIAGGSSSGCGAAVASGAVPGSLGSDTGGSVRIPAAANGLYGLKPTYGLLPRTGSMQLAPSIDALGVFARSTRDLARLLQVIAGGDGLDALCSLRPVPDYAAALGRGIDGLRLGIPRNHFCDALEPPVRDAYERSLGALQAAGARLLEVEVPGAQWMAELSRAIVYPEATALHAAALRSRSDEYTAQVRLRASTGLAIPGTIHIEALRLRMPLLERTVREVFGRCDLLLTPTLPVRIPRRDETDIGDGPRLWQLLARLVHCTAAFNFLGLPALSVPAGVDDRGLPIGLQMVAPPFAEAALLGAAAVHEAVAAPVFGGVLPPWQTSTIA
jgi:aspartyl-tRNA(Asn)/glutamyl-tRNA(Gln) amidotransferase subunit A